jgi:hypothetical protein
MKISTIFFGSAAIALGIAFGAPGAWDRHVVAFAIGVILIGCGLGFATLSGIYHLFRPRRAEMRASQRELDRAYRAGHDTGAAEGPSEATLRRWRHEGFGYEGARRHAR